MADLNSRKPSKNRDRNVSRVSSDVNARKQENNMEASVGAALVMLVRADFKRWQMTVAPKVQSGWSVPTRPPDPS